MSLKTKIIFLIVLTCTISCRYRNEDQSVDKQMNRIESDIGLTFPENSRLDQFFEPYTIEPTWVAKVIIPASSYENFKTTLLAKPDDNCVLTNALSDSTEWWKPENVVLTKQYDPDSQTFVQIVISEEDEEYEVYIEFIVP